LKKYFHYVNSNFNKKYEQTILNMVSKHDFTKMEIAFTMYSISSEAYSNVNLYKRAAYQIYKILYLFKYYEVYMNPKSKDCIEQLSKKAIHYLWYANEDLNVLELNKRKKDFDNVRIDKETYLSDLLVDSEITKIRVLVKDLELKSATVLGTKPEDLKKFYDLYITSPYRINYSIGGRIYRLRLKSKVNYEAYKALIPDWNDLTKWITAYNDGSGDKSVLKPQLDKLNAIYYEDKDRFILLNSEINYILNNNNVYDIAQKIFDGKFSNSDPENMKIDILDNLIADTIYSLMDIVQLSKTMGETYVFTHSFLGSVHEHLSFWIRLYETYEKDFYEQYKGVSQIKVLLKKYLDEEWREQLSGYRENQQALSYYYKALEMHREGRAYHNTIDTMCYVRDDYNDRSDHFNIAEERHLITNGVIEKKIKELEAMYKDSKLYDVNNYYDRSED